MCSLIGHDHVNRHWLEKMNQPLFYNSISDSIHSRLSQPQRELWLWMVERLQPKHCVPDGVRTDVHTFKRANWKDEFQQYQPDRQRTTPYPLYHMKTGYFNVYLLPHDDRLQRISPEIFFKGQRRALLGNPVFHLRLIYRSAAQSKYIFCIFLFRMGGYLECIRFCIYDSIAS
jgi:hypothetical protein